MTVFLTGLTIAGSTALAMALLSSGSGLDFAARSVNASQPRRRGRRFR